MSATNPTPFPNLHNWSQEEERRLRALAEPERNLSASQIAAHFGGKFSRNAIIGKLHRLSIHITHSNGHSRASDSFWNQGDNLRRLLGFYNSPLNYSRHEIAAEFGIEMRLLRRGIEKMRANGQVKPLKTHPNDGRHRNGGARPRSGPRPRTAAARVKARAAHPPSVPVFAESIGNAVTIMQLKTSSCRWPVDGQGWDMKYCGYPAIPGIPYCGPHARRAFARAKRAP